MLWCSEQLEIHRRLIGNPNRNTAAVSSVFCDRTVPVCCVPRIFDSVGGKRETVSNGSVSNQPVHNGVAASQTLFLAGHGDTDMATEDPAEEVPVASTDAYKEETQRTAWVVLDDAYMKVKVRTAPPYKFLSKLEQYGLGDMVTDTVDMDVDDMDTDDVTDRATDLSGFMQDVVVSRVVEPVGYWGDPSAVPDGQDGFDCSELSQTDMSTLITGIIGQGGGDGTDGFDPDRFPK